MGHWTRVLVFMASALLVAVFLPLQADAESQGSYTSASCFRKETYNTTSKVKVQIPVNKTRYDWCLGGFMRCMVYKVEMAEKEINVTEIRSRIVEMCCPGMIPAPGTPAQSTNESLQCIPAPGSATPPITTAATTVVTTTPREVCKTGLWGRGCSHRCLCDGAPCDQDTGVCKPCPPNDESCAPIASTTSTTTTTTTPVPTTPSTTSSTTTSTTPSTTTSTTPSTTTTTTITPSNTTSTTSTTTSTTMISTLASPLSLSNAPEIPVAASTENPHTIDETAAGVNRAFSFHYSVTSPRSAHDISQLGSPPKESPPSSSWFSGTAGAAVTAIAIALAILAGAIFAQTRKRRSKRRPGVVPPPSPPLISAWHSVPHYSDTFTASAVPASTQLTPTGQPTPYSDQFEQPAIEHVYQEITPLTNVTEMSTQPTVTSTPQQDTGPTKVMVKLRNVETYTVVR